MKKAIVWAMCFLCMGLATHSYADVTGVVGCKFTQKDMIKILPEYDQPLEKGKISQKNIPQVDKYQKMVSQAAVSEEWTNCAYVAGLYNYWQTYPTQKEKMLRTSEQKKKIIRRTYEVMRYLAINHRKGQQYILFFEFLSKIRNPLCEETGICNGKETLSRKGQGDNEYLVVIEQTEDIQGPTLEDVIVYAPYTGTDATEKVQQAFNGTGDNNGEGGAGKGGHGGGGDGNGEGNGGNGYKFCYKKCFR